MKRIFKLWGFHKILFKGDMIRKINVQLASIFLQC